MDTKSAWLSTINWTQIVGLAAMIASWFGIDVPEDVRAQILSAIVAIMAVVTWVLRTFHTKTAIKAK